jgi:hypothetical protein
LGASLGMSHVRSEKGIVLGSEDEDLRHSVHGAYRVQE